MKKMVISMGIGFAIICVVIMAGLSFMKINDNKTEQEPHSYQEIAEAYLAWDGITYDNCVVNKVYTHDQYNDKYMTIAAYEDGHCTALMDVDVSYAENMAF